MRTIIALLCALLAFAQPVSARTTDLAPCFRPVEPGETWNEILNQPGNFDCHTHQNSFRPGSYWVRFAIPANARTTGQIMALRTASLWDEGMELAAVRADGGVEHYRPFLEKDISPMRLGGTVVFQIDKSTVPITALVARVSDSAAMRGIMQQTVLSSANDAIRYEMILAVLYASFAGLGIALLVYNLAIWRGIREPFLLVYCSMLVATLAYALATSGALHYIFPVLTGAQRLRLTVPLLALNAACAMLFMRWFFMQSSIPAWLVRLTYIHAGILVSFALVYAGMLPDFVKVLDTIYVYSFLPIPPIVLCYVIYAKRNRDPFLRYFLWAWSAPAVATVARLMFGLNLLPYHILIENSTLIGLACEALVSSLAIGKRVQMLALDRDRAEGAKAQAIAMAETDTLTGLPNRRAFLRHLLEKQRDWQLVLIDIDHFKRVNDTLGHVEGDEVLVGLAAVINSYANKDCIVARLGGEEFAIATIAPLQGGTLVDAEKLLQTIRSTAMPGGYRVTASVGVARRVICDERDWKILYRAADMALYRAKAMGRDRFIDYSAERFAA